MASHQGHANLAGASTATLIPRVTYRMGADFAADSEVDLTSRVTYRMGAAFAGNTSALLAFDGNYSTSSPHFMSGTGGVITVPTAGGAVPHGSKWLQYESPFAGQLDMTITSPTDIAVTYEVYNLDGELLQSDTDGTLGLILSNGEGVRIRVMDSTNGGSLDAGFTIAWSYAARASSRLRVFLRGDRVRDTPGALEINLANGYPRDRVTFSVLGPTTVLDFQTVTLDLAGTLQDYAVNLPALQAGNYYLHCEALSSGSEDVIFAVLDGTLSPGGIDTSDPTPPVVEVARWTFYDIRDTSQNWTLQRNPASWTNMHPPNDFTFASTVAPDGQTLTWQAGARPWRMEFTGYLDDEAEYDRFAFWADKRRRLWLIDHRNRAWLVTLEHFDAQARIKPQKPWAHDYTVRALIFKQATD